MPDRYVVRELEGFRQVGGEASGSALPGLSAIVLDSRMNYRLVREFKSEEARRLYGRGGSLSRDQARARVREQAAELAARLNEATP